MKSRKRWGTATLTDLWIASLAGSLKRKAGLGKRVGRVGLGGGREVGGAG